MYTYISASAAQNEGASPLLATYAQTPSTGNLLLATVRRNSQSGTPTVSDSNGNWTLLASQNFFAAADSQYIFGHIAAGSQPTGITLTATGATQFLSLYEFSGNPGSVASIIDQSAATNSGSGTALTTLGSQPSVTPTNADDLVFSTVGFSSTVTSPSWTNANALQSNKAGTIELVDGYQIEDVLGVFSPSLAWLTARAWGQITVAFFPAGEYLTKGDMFSVL